MDQLALPCRFGWVCVLVAVGSSASGPPLCGGLPLSNDSYNLGMRLGIPTPPFAAVDSREQFDAAIASIGIPSVLKTRRFGYDGKGQFVIRDRSDIEAAWQKLGGRPLILEGFVPFDRELSLISVRGR